MVLPLDNTTSCAAAHTFFARADDAAAGTAPAGAGNGTSTVAPATENKQSYGECIMSWVRMPWDAAVCVAKTLVCFLTLGYCCNDSKASPEVIQKAVKEALTKMNDAEAKDDDKKAAFDAVFSAHTHLRGEIKKVAIDADVKKLGDTAKDEEKVAKGKESAKRFDEAYEAKEVSVLEFAQDHLQKQIDDAKADK